MFRKRYIYRVMSQANHSGDDHDGHVYQPRRSARYDSNSDIAKQRDPTATFRDVRWHVHICNEQIEPRFGKRLPCVARIGDDCDVMPHIFKSSYKESSLLDVIFHDQN